MNINYYKKYLYNLAKNQQKISTQVQQKFITIWLKIIIKQVNDLHNFNTISTQFSTRTRGVIFDVIHILKIFNILIYVIINFINRINYSITLKKLLRLILFCRTKADIFIFIFYIFAGAKILSISSKSNSSSRASDTSSSLSSKVL